MTRKDIDDLEAVLFATTSGYFVAEHGFLTEVVHEWRVEEFGIGGIADGPAGEAAGQFGYVFLRVAAIDT